MPDKVVIIVNPTSGRASKRPIVLELHDRLVSKGHAVEMHITKACGHAISLAQQAATAGAGMVVVWGGDGTIREVVHGLEGALPILILPGGTENLLAKYLGVRLDTEWLVRVIEERCEEGFDLCRMNDHRFLMVAGVGFDAEVVRRLAETRKGNISYASYIRPLVTTFVQYNYPSLRVDIGGHTAYAGRGIVLIGNIPRYGGGLPIHPHARPDDGLLDICVFPCSSRSGLLRHALRVLMGDHQATPDVICTRARQARISSETPIPVEIDGDFGGWLPVEFAVTGQRARFLVAGEWLRENAE